MSIMKKKPRLTEFGNQLEKMLAKLKEPITLVDYAELTGLSYKYISQLRTQPDRRPGSYAIVNLLKPFVEFKTLSLNEAQQFSQRTRGKTLTPGQCRELFPAASEAELHQSIYEALQPAYNATPEPMMIKIIENNYSVPVTVIDFIRQNNPRTVKMLEHNATYGRHYIDAIKTMDPQIKEICLLIHNPLEQLLSDLQKERICAQIRTLKLVGFKDGILKIKCYNQRASLRGRKFDNTLIELGWYTYDYDPEYAEYGKNQMWGHNNPLIVAHLKNEGQYLGKMFDRVFDSLWNDTSNPSLLDVCTKQCRFYREGGKTGEENQFCSVSKEWLKKVSG